MEFWNQEMDQMLTRLWSNGFYTIDEIAEHIGRSRTSIKTRAWRLELGQRTKRIANEWAQRDTDALRRLWEQGLSASMIAERMQKTRNAVLGKVHRLGLKTRRPRHYGRSGRKPKPKSSTSKPKSSTSKHEDIAYIAARIEARQQAEPEPKPLPGDQDRTDLIGIMALTSTTCRWPIGTPVRYCGHATATGSVYCSEHHKRAYQAVRVVPRRHPDYSPKRKVLV